MEGKRGGGGESLVALMPPAVVAVLTELSLTFVNKCFFIMSDLSIVPGTVTGCPSIILVCFAHFTGEAVCTPPHPATLEVITLTNGKIIKLS